jgi:hypothetical protein
MNLDLVVNREHQAGGGFARWLIQMCTMYLTYVKIAVSHLF